MPKRMDEMMFLILGTWLMGHGQCSSHSGWSNDLLSARVDFRTLVEAIACRSRIKPVVHRLYHE